MKGEILEDLRLARAWRARGEWGHCLDGQDVVHVRMYTNLGEIWRGFQKNFYVGFPSSLNFWGFIASHTVCYLLPFLVAPPLLLAGVPYAGTIAAIVVTVLVTRLALALRFRHPLWSVLAHPFGQTFLLLLGINSWWRCVSGKGVSWKGREYEVGAR